LLKVENANVPADGNRLARMYDMGLFRQPLAWVIGGRSIRGKRTPALVSVEP
jgi:hypothetical protein